MKKFIKSLLAVAFILGSVVAGGNTAFAATPGYVSSSVTGVTQTSATFNGTFNPSSLSTTAWFEMQNSGGQQYGVDSLPAVSSNVAMDPFTKTGLNPSTTYSFRAVAQNQTGTTYGPWVSFTTQANNPPAQVSVNFSPSIYNVQSGNSTTIFWTSQNATSCTASAGPQNWLSPLAKPLNGSFNTGALTNNMTYQITCNNGSTWDTDTALVNVTQPQGSAPVVTTTVSPTSITLGGSATLSWSATNNPTSCSASWTNNPIGTSGNIQVSPTVSTNYVVTCFNNFGSDSDPAFLTVNQPQGSAPVVNVTVSPTSITAGSTAIVSWSSTNNPTSCSASWTNNSISTSGSAQVSPNVSTNYTVTCFNNFGSGNDSAFLTVSQQVNPPTVSLTANPTSVFSGGTSFIHWSVSNASSCNATGGNGNWAGPKSTIGGTMESAPLFSTTTFTITCTNAGGSTTDSVSVGVLSQPINPPIVDVSATQTNVQYNGSTTIAWNVSNATSCTATNGTNGWAGSKSVNGGTFFTGNLTNTTVFTLTCSNAGGSASDSVTVTVDNQVQAPTVTLFSNRTNIDYNESVTLTWNVSNATSCNATSGTNGWSGPKSVTGGTFFTGNLTSTTTFTITCTNSQGQIATDSVTVYVQNQNIAPNVTTYNATDINENAATLNGFVDMKGSFGTRWFEWGTSYGTLYTSTPRINQNSTGNYSERIQGLSPNSTYYFRAAAQSNTGAVVYGNVMTFTTTQRVIIDPCFTGSCTPTAVTTFASNVGSRSARLNGIVYVNGSAPITSSWFEWGTSQNLGNITPNVNAGNGQTASFSAFNLQPSTTYFYRIVASNQYGRSNGTIVSFRTDAGGIVNGATTNVIYREVTNVQTANSNARPSLVFLDTYCGDQVLRRGDIYECTIHWKNVSNKFLERVALQVALPEGLDFLQATRGFFSEADHAIVVDIKTLAPQEEGSMTFTTKVRMDAELGISVIASSLVYSYINTDGVMYQEEVFSYFKNTIEDGVSNLGGAALFGAGFWPTSIFGWLLILLLLLLLILVARMAYRRAAPLAPAPYIPVVTKKETTTTTHTEHTV